ncbi:MAG: hypothetical protein A2915_02275 [Candidatus Yanofskybacteria bacterium RIFCSPLOWO2_01_FULL_41_34]|uniref:Guanylate kinase-like domain-containing protein n=1 Tax=Candidatus Yanofskybacteria bacterium RIFCSPHIGHO2_01_FULL_41_26 TaxID=1802661 RepID=A0A1F8ECL9_9BACT|nr:MAG: hypothetical protein A2649_00570 [Candidatus Yanofskybacteria bacterium RIFCSPHIGHO2_01_FULL_41_26]OGN21312.1 MAG: hypothetical protein A2915_02275 [Candidatus Yanofskybacteria bacterium RIFCSPLOWO2_01_FULL_41_34]
MILTLTGASGAGKTTIAKKLLKNLTIDAQMVPSYTIRKFRKPRPTDIPGEYKYVTRLWFWFLEKIGAFLWTVHVHGNSYGTTKRWVVRGLRDDNTIHIMILLSDAIKTLREFAEEKGLLDQVYSFYICSPPQEVLRVRLEKRGDSQGEVKKRLADCLKWDQNALSSGISYEFVKNDGEIREAVVEIKDRFLLKFEASESLF